MATLVLADSELRPLRRLSLDEARKMTIGRAPERDVVISDPGISRFHCIVYREDGGWCIADADSSGGTYVDHQRILWKRLKPGRVAQIGHFRLWIERTENELEATRFQDRIEIESKSDPAQWDLGAYAVIAPTPPARISLDASSGNGSAFLHERKDFLALEPESPPDEQKE